MRLGQGFHGDLGMTIASPSLLKGTNVGRFMFNKEKEIFTSMTIEMEAEMLHQPSMTASGDLEYMIFFRRIIGLL